MTLKDMIALKDKALTEAVASMTNVQLLHTFTQCNDQQLTPHVYATYHHIHKALVNQLYIRGFITD